MLKNIETIFLIVVMLTIGSIAAYIATEALLEILLFMWFMNPFPY